LTKTSHIFIGMILLVGSLLLFHPISLEAQRPESNITNNIQASTQEEEEANKAIIIAFTEAFNDRNYTAIEQHVAENIIEHRPGVMS
jgi:hypothetical protein